MRTDILWKKNKCNRLLLTLFTVLALVGLTGCSEEGKLDEGNCKCSISFVEIPKELTMLEDNLQENFAVNVTLKNIANEKRYHITLTEKNSFKQEISLHPGVYQVYSVYANNASNIGLSLAAEEDSVTLSEDTYGSVRVYVENTEDFTEHWMSVQPMPEMVLAEQFDGLIQINRKVLNLRTDSAALISELNLSHEGQVAPYGKIDVSDTDKGVTLTLQNQTESPMDWRNCTVVGLYVYKNNIVFPQGVTLGMAPEKVCNNETGLYGEPDSFTGSLLYGMGFDDTSVIYHDPKSGDKMTVNLGAQDSSIRSIRYELAQFEEE